ncbi:MAG: hypothetical protein HY401_01760 [Elusimicrobia bacterium]|nr:hypothetical protein [Elusimicrobiota bacterium]
MQDPYEKPPVYILTKDGIASQEELDAQANPPPPEPTQRPWLLLCLFLTLLAFFFDSPDWLRAVERRLDQNQQALGAEPYLLWANRNPLTYDDVAASPASFTGKAVIWRLGIDERGSFLFEGNAQKPILWASRQSEAGMLLAENQLTAVLARIEGSRGDTPVLMFLRAI